MRFNVNDAVEVRATTGMPWLPGTVTALEETSYVVALKKHIPTNEWLGRTRNVGGNANIAVVRVSINADSFTRDELIRPRKES
jgi:hypothetical protein